MSALPFFFVRLQPPPRPPLFPYTTLFRSSQPKGVELGGEGLVLVAVDLVGGDDDRAARAPQQLGQLNRKSTRLNSSHMSISYAVFCLKKKKHDQTME